MYVQIDRRKIHVQQEHPDADRPELTIVLIHGIGQNLWSWDPIIPFLKGFRIIRYDLAGHGSSGIPEKNVYSMQRFSDDLYALLNYMQANRVSFVGYELGACIAMYFANRYPELVERIVTIAHPLYYPFETRQRKIDRQLLDMREKGLKRYICEHLRQLSLRHDLRLLTEAYLSVSMNTYESVLQMLKHFDMNLANNRLMQPVLHLVGEFDAEYPPELMFKAMQYFRSSIIVQVPDAKSLVHVDNPAYTAQQIESFLRPDMSSASEFAREAANYYDTLRDHHSQREEHHLRVDVIRHFEARINGRLLEGNWKIRKAQELLIYMLYNRSVPREKLYDLFWPHLNLENAQNMLRVSINHLKNLIDKPYGTSFIHSQRDCIELRGNIESDLLELLEDIKQFQSSKSDPEKEQIARKISQAVSGDILVGYYNDSILHLRDELINTTAPIIKWIANRYECQGRLLDSILFYKVMLNLLPDELELIQKIAQLYDSLQLKGLAREWQERYYRELHDDM